MRPIKAGDLNWVVDKLEEYWGSAKIVTRAKVHYAETYPGFVAVRSNDNIGLITFRIENDECEIISLNSFVAGIGVGTALLKAVIDAAGKGKCKRVWLITTNDNCSALEFYQKRGFRFVAIYRNAIQESRKLKPEIPLYGIERIPIRDEIEMELLAEEF